MGEPEHIVRALSTHWVKYVMPTVMAMLLVAGISGIFMAALALHSALPIIANSLFIGGVLLACLVHHWYFHRLLSEAMEDIVITTKRVIWIKEALYQTDDMRQIPLDNIQGVETKKHGLAQTILGYGTLWFDTGGTVTYDENAIMDMVPHPNSVARDINQLLKLN
ncbi:MAG: PH domain-containing protein [Candidatus Peregrinibacteria bacterium]|nr:PH domain-containing protein [Candidatus Peregrinibacteria bacterium]MCB9808315.1 PH domain-containing protein [Candidatus Peribacteria bacterium]